MLEPSKHTFETIWGHEAAKAYVLRLLASGRLPPVLLLEGAESLGKRSFALAAAKVILSATRRLQGGAMRSPSLPAARKSNPAPEPEEEEQDLFGASEEPDLFRAPVEEVELDLFASQEEPDFPKAPPPTVAAAPAAQPPPAREPLVDAPVAAAGAPVPTPFLGLSEDVCRRVESSYPVEYNPDGSPTTIGHPDLAILEPSGNSKSILAGQIDALHGIANLPPIQGSCRLVLVFGVDTITSFAANSMLKLLEEPPSYLRFILVTDNPGRVMATIRSRASRIPFFPLKRADIESRLIASEGLGRDLAAVASGFSQGRPGLALRVAHGQVLGKRRDLFDARLSLERLGLPGLPGSCSRILAAGGSYEESILLLLSLLRDRLIARHAPGQPELLVNADVRDLLESGRADDSLLDEEWEALLLAMESAKAPYLPNAQAALECALWRAAEGVA
jgi:DNA polymerase III delta prime subunit